MKSRIAEQPESVHRAAAVSSRTNAKAPGTAPFVDSRAESSAQSRLQTMADRSRYVLQPRGVQLRPARAPVIQQAGGAAKASADDVRPDPMGEKAQAGAGQDAKAAAGAGQGAKNNASAAAPRGDVKSDAKAAGVKQAPQAANRNLPQESDEERDGYIAATNYLSAIPDNTLLDYTEGMSIREVARLPKVHEWLSLAMHEYAKLQLFPQGLAELDDVKTFGLQGKCTPVSKVFSFLLNRIKGDDATSVNVAGDSDHTTHTSVKATESGSPLYIDATWRQGNRKEDGDGNFDEMPDLRTDPRRELDMVRFSREEPTLERIGEAVERELTLKAQQNTASKS